MPLLNLRELLQFPEGDNSTDTVLNGVHFNLTALKEHNYTIYSNNTISNNSRCYLIFDNFKPHMFNNGSWVNATTCYIPYYHIHGRGIASIVFGTFFAISIMFTLVNLRKHGRLYLRENKRFRVVGRRWQWYWMCFVAACGLISTLTGVDVDRYYLQQIPIILQSFFFVLMVPGTLAMVWEATRHWGSWQERQIVDRDPFLLPQDDKRARTEFWLPLVFYLFAWLNFFMVIPRSWTAIQKQNTPEQKNDIARPASTGPREKAGAILAAIAWFVICYSLHHSLKHYKPRATGFFNRINSFCHYCPTKLFAAIVLLAIRIGYGIASAWVWDLSIFQDDVVVGWPFGLGYGSILLIIVVFEVAGFMEQNEDQVIIQQRQDRGRVVDAELGLVKKPNWWSRNWAERYQNDDQRLRNMTTEFGGGRPTTRQAQQSIEMGNMNIRNRSRDRPPEDPFRDQSPSGSRQASVAGNRLTVSRLDSDVASTTTSNSEATGLTGRTLTSENTQNVPPQRIRSMLDV
ncbi:uncharacterized protein BDR25DRAFT_303877 [Lindgomyces ingoldianus]|uniref:Uncharacterized protein n=1 Tax=Lindgomyces ingoldianus TaxID=673940 RepID=A0ACB6QTZ6_9PLEO|nr:uncharacterized protein BDR25DRAFT_303877 [Lindgomyces ingoldianus]KAF2470355.1 hypothetical protein BDR25DRAFT_303877 [Lindgomyces ingoldianus]